MRLFRTLYWLSFIRSSISFVSASILADWQFEDNPGFLSNSESSSHGLSAISSSVTQSESSTNLGKSIVFDGGYLSTDDDDVWTDTSMTIEVLFNSNNATSSGTQILVGHWNASNSQRSWALGLSDGKVRYLQSSNGSSTTTSNILSITSGKDYYLALILEGSSAIVYLKNLTDDTEMESSLLTGLKASLHNSNQPLTIGSTAQPSSQFTGSIGRLRIHDNAIDESNLLFTPTESPVTSLKADGYKGLWYSLGQYTTYGPKYSGGLATYTAKHRPMAVYSPAVNKTFFTYGGTRSANEKHLFIMAGWYDHTNHTVPKPTIVMDKNGVNDPHDNASIQLDQDGYVYIFVSGRSNIRKGFIYKSTEPYSTDAFELISPASGLNFTYPQIWYLPGNESSGDELFFHLFTRYTGGRQLYFAKSSDAVTWSTAHKLAAFGGHYQVSAQSGNKVGTAFNRHPGGNVDKRTDLYYIQTTNNGDTWTTVDGTPVTVPITSGDSIARVIDYNSQGRLVYMKDLTFDKNGHPVIFYLTSAQFYPGPEGEPRLLQITRWDGSKWVTTNMPASATNTSTLIHNYSTGSLHIDENKWTVVAPTGATAVPGSDATQAEIERYWGQGGEMETWTSENQGESWKKIRTLTRESNRKHGYARNPQYAHDPFFVFWSDGNPETLTEVHLYFGNKDGSQYWALPYSMSTDTASPIPQKDGLLRWKERYADPDAVSNGNELGMSENPDNDPHINLIEYYFGTNPFDANHSLMITIKPTSNSSNYKISFLNNPEATDLTAHIEESTTLAENDWQPAEDLNEVIREMQPDGRLLLEYEGAIINPADSFKFYRLSIEE